MVTLERMGEVAEAGHIHPVYCCRVVQGLAHCGYPRHVPRVLSHASPLLIETHLAQKRDADCCWVGGPSGSRDKDSYTAVVRELDSFLVRFPTPQAGPRGKSGLVLFVFGMCRVCMVCVFMYKGMHAHMYDPVCGSQMSMIMSSSSTLYFIVGGSLSLGQKSADLTSRDPPVSASSLLGTQVDTITPFSTWVLGI